MVGDDQTYLIKHHRAWYAEHVRPKPTLPSPSTSAPSPSSSLNPTARAFVMPGSVSVDLELDDSGKGKPEPEPESGAANGSESDSGGAAALGLASPDSVVPDANANPPDVFVDEASGCGKDDLLKYDQEQVQGLLDLQDAGYLRVLRDEIKDEVRRERENLTQQDQQVQSQQASFQQAAADREADRKRGLLKSEDEEVQERIDAKVKA